MTELTEMDVMRAMIRARIDSVGTWSDGVKGKCAHAGVMFQEDKRFNVGWRGGEWSGCARCILTCCDILEDPDMPTESEELLLRAELNPAKLLPRVPLMGATTVAIFSFALGALLL